MKRGQPIVYWDDNDQQREAEVIDTNGSLIYVEKENGYAEWIAPFQVYSVPPAVGGRK